MASARVVFCRREGEPPGVGREQGREREVAAHEGGRGEACKKREREATIEMRERERIP